MALANPGLLWRKTNAPLSSSRTDDIWFTTSEVGWAVNSNGQILKTEDGGNNWTVQLQDTSVYLRCIGFAGTQLGWAGTVSGARRLFATRDGGATWTAVGNLPDKPTINDRQRNSNLEGIGFISEDTGWVGGWGDIDFIGGFTSQPQNGGNNCDNANEVGFRLNRFRFFGNPVTVGYASGDTVYKYSTVPSVIAPALMAGAPSLIRTLHPAIVSPGGEEMVIDVPQNARSLSASVWDRFGNRVELLSESKLRPGPRTIRWNPKDPDVAHLLGNTGVFRAAVDDFVESRLVALGQTER
jgi:hypothetical protein